MTEFIPIHNLLSKGRENTFPICEAGDSSVTWKVFSDSVISLANSLTLRSESRWLIITNDTLDFTIQLLALLYAEKEVIIPPNNQAGTLTQLAGEFEAIVSNDIASLNVSQSKLTSIDPHAAKINLYTSGSTGDPKCVRKSLAQFEAEVAVLEALWGERLVNHAVVATVPHHHIYGLIFRIFWPLSAGRVFDSATCSHPDLLKERIEKFEKCILVSSPAQLSRLPELVSLSSLMTSVGLIFSSGGPLSLHTATEFHQQVGYDPIEIFGSTETGGIAWRRQYILDTWQPLKGVIVDRNDDGAMVLVSPFLPNMSLWQMDDAIELLPEGKFRLLGRLDRIVKIEEKRLSLPEMESLLVKHAWVTNAAAISLSGRRQSVGVVVELSVVGIQELEKHGRRHVSQQLKNHLSERFETVLLPKYWRYLAQMPINAQGKLTHAAISELFLTKQDGYVAS